MTDDFETRRGTYLGKLRDIIAKHPARIAVQAVAGDPPWAYTIGLYERYGFELIVCLLPPEHATGIFNNIAKSLADGVQLTPDVPMHGMNWIHGDYPMLFKRCHPQLLGDMVNVAKAYHGVEDLPVLQLVLCDKQGRFPGEDSYSIARQPLLYEPPPVDDGALLSVWTVYDHPPDYPQGFIARRWDVRAGEVVPTHDSLKAEKLAPLRRQLANLGLVCLARQPGDDPAIVETWL